MAAYFSKTLYLRNLKRFWLISVAVFIVAFFAFVAAELGARGYRALFLSELDVEFDIMYVLQPLATYCTVYIPIFSIITAIAMFGYLHKPRAAGFVSSLPISRLGLYITNWLSGLTVMLAPVLLVGIMYGALMIRQPIPPVFILIWPGIIIASHLFFLSFAVFTTFLTGKPVMQVFLFGLINAIAPIIGGIVQFIADTLIFGYMEGLYTTILLPVLILTPIAFMHVVITGFSSPEWVTSLSFLFTLSIYPILTALLMFFGYRLYRRRKIESAGDIIIHKPIRSVLKYFIGLLMGALLGSALASIVSSANNFSVSGYTICLAASVIVFGALGCLFAEMLIRKRLKVWKTAYKSMLFFAAGIVVIALFIRLDGTGYERRVPNPDNVAAVSFSTQVPRVTNILFHSEVDPDAFYISSGPGWTIRRGTCCDKCYEAVGGLTVPWSDEIVDEIKLRTFDYFESPEAIIAATELHRAIISDKRRLEDGASRSIWRPTGQTVYLTYIMNNGRIMTRRYMIPDDLFLSLSAADKFFELTGQTEAVNKRNRFTTLPDTAVLWMDAIWCESYPSISLRDQDMHTLNVAIDGDDKAAILEALRQDAAAGTLGHIDNRGFVMDQFYYERSQTLTGSPETIIIRILYDFEAAGVPSAFEQDNVDIDPDDHDNNENINGLMQPIIINEYNVNTMRVLRDLGIFDDLGADDEDV